MISFCTRGGNPESLLTGNSARIACGIVGYSQSRSCSLLKGISGIPRAFLASLGHS